MVLGFQGPRRAAFAGWVALATSAVACDSSIRQIGPGTGMGFDTDTGGASGWVCDQRMVLGQCWEYTGAGWDEASATADCGAPVVAGSCPGADSLGGCIGAFGAALERVVYYYAGDYYVEDDATYLRGNCEVNLGTWTGASSGG